MRFRHGLAMQLLVLAVATTAAASEVSSRAAKHFRRGMELYRAGDLDAALTELARAHEIEPSPRLLFNMAQVQAERHDYVRALDLLQRYLDAGSTEAGASRRAEVELTQSRLRERVGMLWLSVDAGHGKLFVNGEPVASLPLHAPVPLNPGLNRLRVEARGRKPYLSELNVAGGDRPRFELTLEPQPGAKEPEPRIDYTPLWVSAIATGALGAGALAFSALTASAEGQLDRARSAVPSDASAVDTARGNVSTFSTLTGVFTVGTIVAAGVGLYYLVSPAYVSEGEGPPQAEGAVRVSASWRSLAFEGSF